MCLLLSFALGSFSGEDGMPWSFCAKKDLFKFAVYCKSQTLRPATVSLELILCWRACNHIGWRLSAAGPQTVNWPRSAAREVTNADRFRVCGQQSC